MARQGIASLRYDDRGWGDKSVNFYNFTTDDFHKDAAAALPLLRKSFNKVGVLGHSEGGTIAMMLAAEGKADFIVSLAGMAISGKETLVMQNHQAMSAVGLPKETVDSYCNTIRKILDEIADGKKANEISIDETDTALKPIIAKALQQADNPYIRNFLTINVSKQLSKIKCPVWHLMEQKTHKWTAPPTQQNLKKVLSTVSTPYRRLKVSTICFKIARQVRL